MRKVFVRFLQVFILVGLCALVVGLAVSAYPPLFPTALAIINRSPNCQVLDVLHGAQTRYRFSKAKSAIAETARLIESSGGLERWQTSEGEYWIPADNGEVLPILIAQQEADEYGDGSKGVREGDIVLDCGAHVGVYTRKALEAGAQLVVAIEPAPINVECLRRNLNEEISAGRVIVYPKGVWDKVELLPLYEDPNNSAADSFVVPNPDSDAKAVLPLVPIDVLLKELSLKRVDVIKMDIKGATLRALEGAKNTLAEHQPRLVISTEERVDNFSEISNALSPKINYQAACGACSVTASFFVEPDVVFYHPNQRRVR